MGSTAFCSCGVAECSGSCFMSPGFTQCKCWVCLSVKALLTECLRHHHKHACFSWSEASETAICRKHRQKRNVTLVVLEGTLQWLNLFFYMLPNALNVANPCYMFGDLWYWFGFARWTCWNTVSHPITHLSTATNFSQSSCTLYGSIITFCVFCVPQMTLACAHASAGPAGIRCPILTPLP